MSFEHIPYIKDDQSSPYWNIRCKCGWKSGSSTQLELAVELYGQHTYNIAYETTYHLLMDTK